MRVMATTHRTAPQLLLMARPGRRPRFAAIGTRMASSTMPYRRRVSIAVRRARHGSSEGGKP
jgi:hypothetical protein